MQLDGRGLLVEWRLVMIIHYCDRCKEKLQGVHVISMNLSTHVMHFEICKPCHEELMEVIRERNRAGVTAS